MFSSLVFNHPFMIDFATNQQQIYYLPDPIVLFLIPPSLYAISFSMKIVVNQMKQV